MGKYHNIAKQLKEKTTSMKEVSDNDIYSCYYCPSSRHGLCPHPSKCIMDTRIRDVLVSIMKINMRIHHLKEQENTEEERNRLIIERKRLFREYYQIETNVGGY